MPTKLVKNGDIIRIKKGMNVITSVPINAFNKEKPFDKGYGENIVEVGQIYRSSPYSRKKIMEMLKNFLSSEFNANLPEEYLNIIIYKLQIDFEVNTFDTSFLEGEYVVYEACYLVKRIAPYQVKCFKKDNPKIRIKFYQMCPAYKANISTEIEVIGNINET